MPPPELVRELRHVPNQDLAQQETQGGQGASRPIGPHYSAVYDVSDLDPYLYINVLDVLQCRWSLTLSYIIREIQIERRREERRAEEREALREMLTAMREEIQRGPQEQGAIGRDEIEEDSDGYLEEMVERLMNERLS
jgi:hypothetical protein